MSRPPKAALGYDLCWAAALALGEFSYFELSDRAGVGTKLASGFVLGWEREGVVKRLGKSGPKNRLRFALVDAEQKRPMRIRRDGSAVRSETLHGNMWTVMRSQKTFRPIDVAALGSTEITHVTENAARDYCRMLVRAGYLRAVQKAIPGRRDPVYRLIRDTGPMPPRERRVRAVYDDNKGEFTHIAGAGE